MLVGGWMDQKWKLSWENLCTYFSLSFFLSLCVYVCVCVCVKSNPRWHARNAILLKVSFSLSLNLIYLYTYVSVCFCFVSLSLWLFLTVLPILFFYLSFVTSVFFSQISLYVLIAILLLILSLPICLPYLLTHSFLLRTYVILSTPRPPPPSVWQILLSLVLKRLICFELWNEVVSKDL